MLYVSDGQHHAIYEIRNDWKKGLGKPIHCQGITPVRVPDTSGSILDTETPLRLSSLLGATPHAR